ncbi:MAG: hypothetical protein RIC36_12585 [Rhodospirillales bacterium]
MTEQAINGRTALRLDRHTVMTVMFGGALATVAFDFFGQSISPMLGFSGLAPVPLANNVIRVLFGEAYSPGAHFLHYLAGMVAYPVGWLFIARPVLARLVPGMSWLPGSVIYGVGLWIFALYIMAHLVAGNPAFLGFTGITWVALAGHILFAVVFAAVAEFRRHPAAGLTDR